MTDFPLKAMEIVVDGLKSIIAASTAFGASYIIFFKELLPIQQWKFVNYMPPALLLASCGLSVVTIFLIVQPLKDCENPIFSGRIEWMSGMSVLCFLISIFVTFIALIGV